jgi:putative ABC transport system permease protein
VLKTLGFTNGGVLGLVLAEAVLITVIGGALGLAGAWWLGVQFEPVFRQYLPGFRVPTDAIVLGAVFMVGLGFVAGAVPAAQAMRLRIVEALRRE